MINTTVFNRVDVDLRLADELQFNPYYPAIQSRKPGKVKIGDRWFVDCASNDYLGLAADSALKKTCADTISRYGVSLCGTPIAAGGNCLLKEMEERIASFTGCEDTMAFPSCYQANVSFFRTLCTKEDVILIDHYAHASLVEGAKAAGCRIMPYLHNDCDHLEKHLRRSRSKGNIFIVTESVFSTEGTIAPFDKIYELCERYGALPVIDDSHGIGVIGEGGAGVLSHFGIHHYEGIYTASLGKALANSGGIIGAGKNVITALKYRCPGSMYSTAVVPAVAAGVLHVMGRLQSEYQLLRDALQNNVDTVNEVIDAKGFQRAGGAAPIISMKCGSIRNTLRCARAFFTKGVVVTPFVEPSVPPGNGVVRIIPGAGIAVDECREAVSRLDNGWRED
jgi:7-keto-8-aminopelargonate synthetase-like enzyme